MRVGFTLIFANGFERRRIFGKTIKLARGKYDIDKSRKEQYSRCNYGMVV